MADPDLDDTDREIIRLLQENARMTHTELGEHVGLSPPAAGARVEGLVDAGVITGFSADVDRAKLTPGVRVFVVAKADDPGAAVDRLADTEAVEVLFSTVDFRVGFYLRAKPEALRDKLAAALGEGLTLTDFYLVD